jgi:hypothetical protein
MVGDEAEAAIRRASQVPYDKKHALTSKYNQ